MDCYVLKSTINALYRTSTPLACIETVDPLNSQAQIVPLLHKQRTRAFPDSPRPILAWDAAQGLRPINQAGVEALAPLLQSGSSNPFEQGGPFCSHPADMLRVCGKLPDGSVVIAHNLHKWWQDAVIMQAVQCLRDVLKASEGLLLMLGASAALPPELAYDVAVFHEPRPDDAALAHVVTQQHKYAEVNGLTDDVLGRAVDALRGLPLYTAEQETAMCLSRAGLDLDALYERQRQVINATGGLTMWRGGETFADIGGLTEVKWLLSRVLNGRRKPKIIIYLDELEKSMGGVGTDTSGVSQDLLSVLLRYMQDNDQTGLICIGPPGTAKSLTAKAAGAEAGIPTISLDIGALKDPRGLVGGSEHRARQAMDTIQGVSGGQALFIATSNKLQQVPAELRSRFRLGTVFFDLPDKAEREAIWTIQGRKYPEIDLTSIPADEGWTGREISACAELAWRLDCTLEEAAQRIVPVSVAAKEQIQALRAEAQGRYLSASYAGVYRMPVEGEKARQRAYRLE